ncbi:MAG: hypothetical protein WCO94_08930 [Verrucomicrobiota bacterium]
MRLLVLFVVFGATVAFGTDDYPILYEWREAILLGAIVFLVAILWVPFVCLMQHIMASMVKDYRLRKRPSFHISPFAPRKPLQLWYFLSFMCLSLGAGLLFHSFIFFGIFPPQLLIYVGATTGMLLGCNLAFVTHPAAAGSAPKASGHR